MQGIDIPLLTLEGRFHVRFGALKGGNRPYLLRILDVHPG